MLRFLKEGQRLVFREGRTKAVGNVTLVIPHNPIGAAKKGEAISERGGKAMEKAARNEQRHNKTATSSTSNKEQPPQQTVAS